MSKNYWDRINELKKENKPMKKQSVTITGLIVILLGFILERSGVEVGPEKLQTFMEVLLQLGGFIMAYIGRLRQGDVSILGRKR